MPRLMQKKLRTQRLSNTYAVSGNPIARKLKTNVTGLVALSNPKF